jgi:IS605 OrfB family transposase
MKLIAQVKLQPTPAQAAALLDTLVRANAAANEISRLAWAAQEFGHYKLHHLVYHPIRQSSGLAAQVIVRLEAKVTDAYKLDRQHQRVFMPYGAISYDDRILRWLPDSVSIWTTAGRQRIPFICDARARALLATQQGESDLVYRDGQWYLFATCNVEEPPLIDPQGFLGVDLGIVNIATDSNGTVYSGGQVNALRRRHRRLRAKLQAKGTRAAKRLLRQRRRKETRFATHVNHTLSKRIVATAKAQSCGIALENLQGIRQRVRLRHGQRATLHSWAFLQLRQFLTYKAQLAGVPLVLVDPCNTSRTCPACGHSAKTNRPTQSKFLCCQCGFAGLADHIAAGNIARRAVVNQPYFAAATLLGTQAPSAKSPCL